MGRSFAGVSYVNPSRAYAEPGRFGSLSAKTSGSTIHSQYGTPTVPSVPMEPYLNSVWMSVAARAVATAHAQMRIASAAVAAPSIRSLNDPMRLTTGLVVGRNVQAELSAAI